MPNQILPPLSCPAWPNSSPVMSAHRPVRCYCLFVCSASFGLTQSHRCLFVCWPDCVAPSLLAGHLFVCSLRRGLSRPSLFVCLFQGCSRPLLSILALMRSGRHIGLLLSCYGASMVLSTRKFAPQIMRLPH
jgi:hypothetical protein